MSQESRAKRFFVKFAKVLLPLMLIAAGGGAWAFFKATAPVVPRAAPQREATVVQVQAARQTDSPTMVEAMGTVVASREVTLKARVAGEVRQVAGQFVPGGRLAKGEVLLRLDPSDYEVDVQKAQSALAEARAALAIEEGSQTIAREEYRLLARSSPEAIPRTDLALRKPQLQQAEAVVASAEADLRQARLDLERTVVRVPFNALVLERSVNLGAYVSAGSSLATVVGTDEFWVEAVVSLDDLAHIDFDYPGGCPVQVRSQAGGGRWNGKVVRITGKLSETSRMATVIVAVADPLGPGADLSAQRLMIDDYVNVVITGRPLAAVIELPRAALQDGGTVWVCNGNSLDIRPVTLAWKSSDKVYIQSGLAAGEQVVVSALSSPVQGMSLKVVEPQDTAPAATKES